MTPPSDTPRTDEYIGDQSGIVLTAGEEAMCEFARTLERELNEARKEIVELRNFLSERPSETLYQNALSRANEALKQRDAYREVARRMKEALLSEGDIHALYTESCKAIIIFNKLEKEMTP